MKKNIICMNCGLHGHEQKYCNEPIKSYGIILVDIDEEVEHITTDIKEFDEFDGIKIGNKNDYILTSNYMSKINFLLVRRKHSLGFYEFVRGKYVVGNINGIRGLFSQMIPLEIEIIKNSVLFDELWIYLWGIDNANYNKREYEDSKVKYEKLKEGKNLESDLNFYLKTAQHEYFTPEWGFPKGRKKYGESDLVAAVREFREETHLCDGDIKIIRNTKPIEENLIGTNGVSYKHIYFLAEINKDKRESVYNKLNNKFMNKEIGKIGFFNFAESCELLRDYHIDKKSILKCLMNYYIMILKKMKNKKNENNDIDQNVWI